MEKKLTPVIEDGPEEIGFKQIEGEEPESEPQATSNDSFDPETAFRFQPNC